MSPLVPVSPLTSTLRWPAERFYWALLDAAALGRSRRSMSREQLGYMFEGFLPGLSIDDMQVAYRRLPGAGSRYLACGIPRSVLRAEVGADAIRLSPAQLPAFVEGDIEPDSINLLTGPFLPRGVRRLRAWRLASVAAVVLACAAVIVLGIGRRIEGIESQRRSFALEKSGIFARVLGEGLARASDPARPPEMRMTVLRRELERTRRPDVELADAADCSLILADLLRCWPADVPASTEAVSISPASVQVRTRVPTMADGHRLASAFEPFKGWRAGQPQYEARRGEVEVMLRFEPLGEGSQ